MFTNTPLARSRRRLFRLHGRRRRDLPLEPLGRVDGLGHSLADLRVVEQEAARVLPALADALALVRVPGPALLDDAALGAEVEQIALLGDAPVVEDVELGLPEGRRHLVL